MCYPVSQGSFVPFDGAKVGRFLRSAMFFDALCAETALIFALCQRIERFSISLASFTLSPFCGAAFYRFPVHTHK
jgi:hypothetical protein